MPLPIVYRKSAEAINATYDFFDGASAIGYKDFYCINTSTTDATTEILSPVRIASSQPVFTTGTWTVAKTLNRSKTWELLINKPIIFEGNFSVACTIITETLPDTRDVYMDVLIYHVSTGGTATLLKGQSGANVSLGAAADVSARLNTTAKITARKFAKGDTLRIITQWYSEGSAATGTARIFMDGAERADSLEVDRQYRAADVAHAVYNNSDMIITVPFRIDL